MADPAFMAISVVTLAAAIVALEAREIIYGAFALGVMFVGVAGLYITLNATLVAMFQITVYVGAVVVLIIFTIMLVSREEASAEEINPKEKRLGILAAAGAFAALAYLISYSGLVEQRSYSASEIGVSLLGDYGYALLILAMVLTSALIGALTLVKADAEKGR